MFLVIRQIMYEHIPLYKYNKKKLKWLFRSLNWVTKNGSFMELLQKPPLEPLFLRVYVRVSGA